MDGGQRASDPSRMAFSCPVCSGIGYIQVVVPRPNGKRYVTSFFACGNCTTMFLDPDRFSKDRAPKVVSLVPEFRLLRAKPAASRRTEPSAEFRSRIRGAKRRP
jgi:hypothetical protein